MDDFNLEKLAKEIVVERLTGVEDAPSGAGEVARLIVTKAVTGTQARQAPHDSVVAVCRGLMSGMLLLGKDLPATAVAILGQMGAVAADTNQDPAELMTWAIEGLAPVASIAGRQTRDAVEEAIEAAFMGAGGVFSRTCEAAGA
ncbi:MAG: hypothetical protein PHS14_17135 [Elusimicrobia bacterium]|nr:hypothetical protein [Elusimicrobiota bacterium]